jgi:UDP-2,3-diacylglucosamine pyrophosphatase LpxH
MLVFISDLHLTDGSSGETINPDAFEKFTYQISQLAQKAKARELQIVLLGDIFDIIRSDTWLKTDSVRPWSSEDSVDKNGDDLRKYTTKILSNIIENPKNRQSISLFQELKSTMEKNDVPVQFTYITGNHDWLINRYPETRMAVSRCLLMPDSYEFNKMPDGFFWNDYKVYARHGDLYDPINYERDRDRSSLGDAIVIELVNRFHNEAEEHIRNADPQFLSLIKEIDNVRPMFDIPVWIDKIKEIWNNLVKDFMKLDFVKQHNRIGPDYLDVLKMVFGISELMPLSLAARVPFEKIASFICGSDKMINCAFKEDILKRNEAQFIVYGHTHKQCIVPLDQVPLNDNSIIDKMYFNTGTWRRVHERTKFDIENQEFTSWQVMSFVVFYKDGERIDTNGNQRRFEVWSGALG